MVEVPAGGEVTVDVAKTHTSRRVRARPARARKVHCTPTVVARNSEQRLEPGTLVEANLDERALAPQLVACALIFFMRAR